MKADRAPDNGEAKAIDTTQVVGLRLPIDLVTQLRERAKTEERTQAAVATRALRAYLETEYKPA